MIKQKWEQLSARDQRILKIGGIALGILFFLRLIWWPLYHRIDTLKTKITQEQALLKWMAPRVDQLLASEKSGDVRSEKSFPLLEKSLQDKGLKPFVTQFSQNAQKQISITFADVPFEPAIKWLESQQAQGWMVQHMTARRGEKPGIVQMELVLR